jgi:hypothetical protein
MPWTSLGRNSGDFSDPCRKGEACVAFCVGNGLKAANAFLEEPVGSYTCNLDFERLGEQLDDVSPNLPLGGMCYCRTHRSDATLSDHLGLRVVIRARDNTESLRIASNAESHSSPWAKSSTTPSFQDQRFPVHSFPPHDAFVGRQKTILPRLRGLFCSVVGESRLLAGACAYIMFLLAQTSRLGLHLREPER